MRKPLRFFLLPLPLLLLYLLCLHLFRPVSAADSKPYGVFIGLETTDLKHLHPYRTIMTEPSSLSVEQIKTLQAEGESAYGYLNLGFPEGHRPYYERLASPTLAPYENWLSEYWMDISSPAWQALVADELGGTYAALGLDGFFFDNYDIYAFYSYEDTFNGLTTTLRGLSHYQKPCIINDGDASVNTRTENGSAHTLFGGVNQEGVLTKIDLAKNRYVAQDTEARAYYLDYLTRVREAGLKVYLIEYRPAIELAAEIQSYYEKNSFTACNINGKELC